MRIWGALLAVGVPILCGFIAMMVTVDLVDGREGLGQGIGQLLASALMVIAVACALIGTAIGLGASCRPLTPGPDAATWRDFYRVSSVLGAACLLLGLAWLAWIHNLAPPPASVTRDITAKWVQTSWLAVTLGLILLCGPGLLALAETRALGRAAGSGPDKKKDRPV